MVAKTLRGMLQVTGGLLAGLAIILVLVGWRLSTGPISLAFITPYIEKALSQQHDRYTFRLDDTVLTWAGWDRTLDIRIVGARIFDGNDKVLAVMPELSLSLSAEALVDGVIAPRSIDLFSPVMHLVRQRDGDFQVAFSEDKTDATMVALRVLRMLATEADQNSAMSYLSRIAVHNADLTITDQNLASSWRAPNARAELFKTADGVKGELSGDIETGAEKANISVLGAYSLEQGRIDVGVSFSGLTPSRFAGLSEELKLLESLDVPLQGTLTVTAKDDGEMESVGFDVGSTGGTVKLAKPIDEIVAVDRLEVKGRYGGQSGLVELERVALIFDDNAFIPMLQPSSQRIPLKSIAASARFDRDRDVLEIFDATIDLKGPSIQAEARVEDVSSVRQKVKAEATLINVPIDQLETYWPDALADDARNWSLEHLRDGDLSSVSVAVELVHDKDREEATVVDLNGTMNLDYVTVDYLPPMPPVTKAVGVARFNDNKFSVYVKEGQAGDLTVSQGAIFLTQLDTNNEQADIELQINGPVQSAMHLIDHEPLRYAEKVGMDPADTGGEAAVELKLSFPLLNDLELDQVDVTAQAELTNVAIKDVVLHHDLSDGVLHLEVDKTRITVDGDAKLSGIPAYLTWTQNFVEDAPFLEQYDVEARITGVDDLNDLGLELEPFRGDIVDGVVNAKIRYTVLDERNAKMVGSAELGEVAISIPEIGWQKEKAQPGHAEMEMVLKDNLITAIPNFLVETGDLEVRGSVSYDSAGTGLDAITFDKIGFEKTDVSGRIEARTDGGWAVSMRGKSFDLEPLWKEFIHRRNQAPLGEDLDDEPSIALGMAIDVDRIWLGENRALDKVSGRFRREGDIWRTVILKSVVGPDQTPLEFRIKPDGYTARRLQINADDAGLALKTLGIYDNMVGGSLVIQGQYNDLDSKSPLSGQVQVSDFRVINAPVLAHVVSIMSLTGILDALQGDGLGFINLNAPFTLEDGIITLKDARSTGIALGWTANGTFDTAAEMFDLEGTLVPAYAINSALGYIPILGDLFTGGEKGGGVFAANYSIKGWAEQPDVQVSTLSALAPGFLRNMFQTSQDTASALSLDGDLPIRGQVNGEAAPQANQPVPAPDAEAPVAGQSSSSPMAPKSLIPKAGGDDNAGRGL